MASAVDDSTINIVVVIIIIIIIIIITTTTTLSWSLGGAVAPSAPRWLRH